MRSDERLGFTLIELLIVVAIVGIIAAIAGPGLLRARMSANEASAIASLRAIFSAQAVYSKSCTQGAYATDLAVLAIGGGGSTNGFISPDLASNGVVKSGYGFTLSDGGAAAAPAATTCNNQAAIAMGFADTADPVSGWSGSRHFGSNTTGTIWEGSAALAMTSLGAPAGGTPIR
jgi:type IV pilus assembly protein PilA